MAAISSRDANGFARKAEYGSFKVDHSGATVSRRYEELTGAGQLTAKWAKAMAVTMEWLACYG